MDGAGIYRRLLAVSIFFTVAAGDFWRYLLSWWGWGAIALTVVVLSVIELVRARVDVRRIPIPLLAFLGFAILSIAWSYYPGATALGLVLTLAGTVVAVFIAGCLHWREAIAALRNALAWVLGLSLIFELFVGVVVRAPVLPFWVDYSDLEKIPKAFYWSRALLFEGGRIQGIVGNSNLLGMIALLAAILYGVRLLARSGSPIWNWFWLAVAVGTLALTRSSTVIVATVAVVLLAVFLLIVRRMSGRGRLIATIVGAVLAVGAVVAAVLAREPLLNALGKSSDLTHRLEIWQDVTNLAVQRPVAGWGWVGYWNPWVAPFDDLAVYGGVRYLQAHNAWLDVFLQLGAIGLLIFAFLVLSTLGRSWQLALEPGGHRLHRLDWPMTAIPLLLLTALLVQSLAESRLLLELGWAIFVVIAIKTSWRDSEVAEEETG